jgi:GH24 family phage-related lysozyme (muramidase)
MNFPFLLFFAFFPGLQGVNLDHIPDTTKTINIEQTSQECAEFIAHYEGFSATPYMDASGRGCVVGFGQYSECDGPSVSRESSLRKVQGICTKFIGRIQERHGNLSQNQLVALASFAYNTPVNKPVFTSDKFKEAVAKRDRNGMSAIMMQYAPFRGNAIRRQDELELFFK